MNHYYLAEGSKKNNLGDIIQGMSARAFLNENAICLDREKLDLFDGEEGLLIANGWFMHNYNAFPPSRKLKPLYISFHLASIRLLFSRENRIHFRKFGPVGCRDRKTQLLFLLNGISAYYSGCLTLTFKKSVHLINESTADTLVLVDNVDHKFPLEIISQIKKISTKELKVFNHDPIQVEGDFKAYLKVNEAYINDLMKEYMNAGMVITNKLHCALPCLSLGLKVIFIHPNPTDARLNIISKLMPIYSYSQVLSWNTIPDFKINNNILSQIQNKLKKLTNNFIQRHQKPIDYNENFQNGLMKFSLQILPFLLAPLGYLIRKYKSN